MSQGVLQKTYERIVGFFEQHISGTTNTIHMLFTNCVKYNKYNTNIEKASWNPGSVEPVHCNPADINPGSFKWVDMRNAR